MQERTAAIVLAAGQGKRMNSRVQKQYLLLEGKPVLYYSLKAFQDSFVDEIVLVTGRDEIEYCRKEIVDKYAFTKVIHITEGGRERYHSVYAGLCTLRTSSAAYVMIHDGARPFLDAGILQRVMETVRDYRACVCGMPSKDTVKLADEEGYAATTPPRDRVWMIQTPQAFEYGLIEEAYTRLITQEKRFQEQGVQITDDAMVVELLTDCRVKLTEGSYENIKITTPEDMQTARLWLEKRQENSGR